MQVRGQRFDARWQHQREAYAALFSSVEQVRGAMGHAYSVWSDEVRQGGAAAVAAGSRADEARQAVYEAMKSVWFQQSLLRLSVTRTEYGTVENLVAQVVDVMRRLEAWCTAMEHDQPAASARSNLYLSRSGELNATVEHVMSVVKGWLDAVPDVDRPQQPAWRRLWPRARRSVV